jgi:peroxiredoxin
MAKQLKMGDRFPEYQVQTVDGTTLQLPQDLASEYSVLIFYRGGW